MASERLGESSARPPCTTGSRRSFTARHDVSIVRGDRQKIGSSVQSELEDVQNGASFVKINRDDEQTDGASHEIERGDMTTARHSVRSFACSVREEALSMKPTRPSLRPVPRFEGFGVCAERLDVASVETLPSAGYPIRDAVPVGGRSVREGGPPGRLTRAAVRTGEGSVLNVHDSEQHTLTIVESIHTDVGTRRAPERASRPRVLPLRQGVALLPSGR